MSADNWTTCPKCLAQAQSRRAGREKEIESAYGTVPLEEFKTLQEAVSATNKVNPDDYESLREDYEIFGARTGTVSISYRGSCSNCGLLIDFKYNRPFYPNDELGDEE